MSEQKSLRPRTPIVDIRNTNGETPLMVACRQGNFTTVAICLWNRADVRITNADNQTAMDLTADPEISDLLRYRNVFVTVPNNSTISNHARANNIDPTISFAQFLLQKIEQRRRRINYDPSGLTRILGIGDDEEKTFDP